MNNSIQITQVKLSDIDQLQDISRSTFLEAFSSLNSHENMAKYIEDSFSIEKLTTELRNQASSFYFAKLDGQVIAYLKLNVGAAQTDVKDNKALEIERIYVLKDYYGQKVGQLLFEKAIAVATQLKFNFVWLGVWEKNIRAINFYKKNGFEAFDTHVFTLGDDKQTDIMMKKILHSA
ncbi:GNAT family N-acetyltransferase [Pedobacter sp.]|uniref:GNAT family N-acetyltransferase n=1 Tax=Pedobacter sp. TaxID=1411316 RepID=UPI003D7FC860